MLDLLRQIGTAVVTIAEGAITLVKWLPMTLTFSLSAMSFVPTVLVPVAGVTVVIYLAKLLLGGDNS